MHDPERYEKNKSAAARDAEVFVPRLIKDMAWKKKEVVLDYGCGAGSTGARFILPQVNLFESELYSADVSSEMIEYAKKTYPGMNYVVGNILSENFPYAHLQFDKIFAIYVLHFVKNYREALERFYSQLKPGGQLGLTVLAKSAFFIMHKTLGKDEKWSQYMQGYESYIPRWIQEKETAEVAFKKTLNECGFEILKLETHVQTYFFDKFETLLDLYLSLIPFIKSFPSELHEELKQECRIFLADFYKVNVDAESIETKYDLLYVVARKSLEN